MGLLDRVDLLKVAAEFLQKEVLVWLLRDATIFERELLFVFAVERKVADSLVAALENGFIPWWGGTLVVALNWRASRRLSFWSAPVGFSLEGGWYSAARGM